MSEEATKKYVVQGEQGSAVEIAGVSHAAGAEVELDEATAEKALSEGKVVAVEGQGSVGDSTGQSNDNSENK